MKVNYRLATLDDLGAMIRRGMRPADEREALRLGMDDPYLGLWEAFHLSDIAVAAYYRGQIACMFGVAPVSLLADEACIWLVGHEDVERHWLRFLRECRPALTDLIRGYRLVHNIIDQDNVLALGWLGWLGFTVDQERPILLPGGHVFYRFWKEA